MLILLKVNGTKKNKILDKLTLDENLDSVIRFIKEIRNSCNIPIIVGGNAIKSASKSQIQLL